MKRPPVFLFAFANQQDAYLEALKGEERAIRECLSGLHDQQQVEFHNLSSTGLDDIYRNFNRFHNRIAVFHYGGHSNSEGLELEDAHARAANLATLMGMQGQLQLVVLNGCSNRAQAALLLEAGVKVVVGTSCAIDDDKAGIFAGQFYDALAKGKNIRQAFDGALSYLSDKRGIAAEGIFRGPARRSGEEVPWGLYYQEEEALLWTAPATPAESRMADERSFEEDVSIPHRKVNESLILQVARGMERYHTEVKEGLLAYQQAPHPELHYSLRDKVLDKLPTVVSMHLGALFSPKALPLSRQRLLSLNDVYLALSRYLAGIALSNLWDACLDEHFQVRADFQIQPGYRQDLQQYLRLDEKSAETYDYFWLLATIHRILEDNGAQLFMDEFGQLQQLMAEDKSCYDAYRFLEQELRQPLAAGRIHKEDIGALCLQAEHHLGRLLDACAFLSTYDMAAIRDIRVNKGRREASASFLHEKSLMRGPNEKANSILDVSRKEYMDNQAVVASKGAYREEQALNLTPFIIDINAFSTKRGGLPDIHFFHGRASDGRLCYQRAREMKDRFYIEKEGEGPMAALTFSLEFDGMEILYRLFDEFAKDLKLK